MKVFVLLYDNGYDGCDFHGVFSSKEKAEEYIKRFSDDDGFYIDDVHIDENVFEGMQTKEMLSERMQILDAQSNEIDEEYMKVSTRYWTLVNKEKK